ncbi:MAG: peptidoglycan-binding protein [Pseudomonadota bacterium]
MANVRRRYPKPHRGLKKPVALPRSDVTPTQSSDVSPKRSLAIAAQGRVEVDTPIDQFAINAAKWILLIILIIVVWQVSYNAGEREVLEEWAEYPLFTEEPFVLPAREGGPCSGFSEGRCPEATETSASMDRARYFLRRGDAEKALDQSEKARVFYSWSVETGRPVGAQAARMAATRLQFMNLTCDYDATSLARIARDNNLNALGGEISTAQRQRALRALAHYVGEITGRQSRQMRESIRRFQSSLWFDETGVLTSEQVVLAVCGAAEIGLDAASQNLLGSMYAVGLGTRQSTDKALLWFQEAARQGSADANWNLALLFGTQTTESSVLVCDADQNAERADSYLKDAYDAGHPGARQAVELYGDDTPEERWRSISAQIRKPTALTRVGKGCNPNG